MSTLSAQIITISQFPASPRTCPACARHHAVIRTLPASVPSRGVGRGACAVGSYRNDEVVFA
ncbi:hypothetical protein F1645_14495 [Novacetimonas hansenii]|uniref:Uncharacterized protein n=1 Tax=Novacetimonas hansenii ATCC 23769 TaxID=714995 RepID=D5QCD3_NOVHA|nr:hypothetical protein [Novacetimonas hansenii]EFG85329.1 hypothetical protein GXY_03928 [Novacetimonas hansenii ATCC 23769]